MFVSLRRALGSALLLPLLLASALSARAQTEKVIYSFCSLPNCKDGDSPAGGVVRDAKGNLYGETTAGGKHQGCQDFCGTVFEVTPAGKEKVLYSFTGGADGETPLGGLVRGANGDLYGTTLDGGTSSEGNVFRVTPAGKEKVLYSFTGGADGGFPFAGLVLDAKYNLYGATSGGGSSDWGTVFEVTTAGKEKVRYSFMGGKHGADPLSGLVADAQGNLYGTTNGGGGTECEYGCGTIFEVTPRGKETVLYSFSGAPDDGAYPSGPLLRDARGNLYGVTSGGGAYSNCYLGCGIVFRVTSAGTETVLYNFTGGADGASPNGGLIQDGQGNLYGTAAIGGNLSGCGGQGCGVVFEVTPAGTETVLYTFTGGTDGATPSGGLVADAQGNLYSTTSGGGAYGWGTVFEVVR